MKEVFDFIEEEYKPLLRHVPTRWLSLLPAILRFNNNWAGISSYFYKLGSGNCPSYLWKYFSEEEDVLNHVSSRNTLLVYLKFLSNILPLFDSGIKKVESSDISICEIWKIMDNLHNQLLCRKRDLYFGFEAMELLKYHTNANKTAIEKDFVNFVDCTTKYLEKWFNFSDSNYFKELSILCSPEEVDYAKFAKVIDILKLSNAIDMDACYEEFCRIGNDLKNIKNLGENQTPMDMWEKICKNYPDLLPNLTSVLGFIFSIPVTNAFCERVFSLMENYWSDDRAQSGVTLIKSEIQVKTNFSMTCQQFYTFCIKNKQLLKNARSTDKY